MSDTVPSRSEAILICDLCGRSCQRDNLAIRGKVNFCQECASSRPAECLSALQTGKSSKWMRNGFLAVLSLGVIGGGGWAGWTYSLQHALPPKENPSRTENSSLTENVQKLEHQTEVLTKITTNALQKRQVTDVGNVHLLFVAEPGTDSTMGLASRLYAIREAPDPLSAKLTGKVGSEMEASFQEGIRYVQKLPRDWEKDFSIRLSFEDKFTPKDGASAATGFTVAMLAAIQNFALDPELALTGDLTIDGEVQPIGGVPHKIRGAIMSKCKITLVPERNSRDVADLVLLDGIAPLWDTQVFSIATIDEAVAMVRQDRDATVQQGIDRFNRLRARLPAVVTTDYLKSPIVISELMEVLKLAPHHLSAATLLQVIDGRIPKELSLNQSVDEIIEASYLFIAPVVTPEKEPAKNQSSHDKGLTVFPEREYGDCIKRLNTLTPILDKRSLDLKVACIGYASALRASVTNYRASDVDAFRARAPWSSWGVREINYAQQHVKDEDDARSKLLLTLRKLHTDHSLLTELNKK